MWRPSASYLRNLRRKKSKIFLSFVMLIAVLQISKFLRKKSEERYVEQIKANYEELSKRKIKQTEFANVVSLNEPFLLVIFTTFSTNPEKNTCRNNTIYNWKLLGSKVKPVLFTTDPFLSKVVSRSGWDVLTPKLSSIGIPILKDMFLSVMNKYKAQYYGYSNSDIIFSSSIILTLQAIFSSRLYLTGPLLIVGRRMNVYNVTKENASSIQNVIGTVNKKGNLFSAFAEDYFVTNDKFPWHIIPDLVVGRPRFDNWLVIYARQNRFATIDAARTLLALHQTTQSGNFENQRYSHGNFNTNLLQREYGYINYRAGETLCTTYCTFFSTEKLAIEVKSRNLKSKCFPL